MRTRKRAVQVYLNEKEHEKLEQLSRFSGNSHSAVIRKLITGKEIRQRPDLNFRALAMEISAIGNNLNQIARRANQMQVTTADLKEAKLLMMIYAHLTDAKRQEGIRTLNAHLQGTLTEPAENV